MESPDLNPNSSPDDRFDALLRRAAPAPLEDNGFTRRVMASLPEPRRSRGEWGRWGPVALGAAAGLAGIVLSGGSGFALGEASLSLSAAAEDGIAAFANPGFVLGLAVTAACLAALAAFDQLVED